MSTTARQLAGEFLGTALLLFVIVGSGIVADRLSDDGGVELLTHSIGVGAGLAAIIAFLAPVSGAHFNPAEPWASGSHGQSNRCWPSRTLSPKS
ncbi:MAG: aquaporin [Acidimicrobiia bacterium]